MIYNCQKKVYKKLSLAVDQVESNKKRKEVRKGERQRRVPWLNSGTGCGTAQVI